MYGRRQDERIAIRCFKEEKALLAQAARITTRKGDLGPWLLELGLMEATKIVNRLGSVPLSTSIRVRDALK